MKLLYGHIAFAGVVVAVFIVLVGALGYTYLVRSNSQVADNAADANSADSQTLAAPEIAKTDDLDNAIDVLDSATLEDDLATIDSIEQKL